MNEQIFTTYKISDGVYRISEFGLAACYLIIGDTSALLIDTANGIGNIREVAQSLTDLPITVALTHNHPDHAGGAYHFDKIYLARADDTRFFNFLLKKFARFLLVMRSPAKQLGAKYKHICPAPRKTKRLYFDDGHIFHLGNKNITVRLIPGHTLGSAVFIDEAAGLIFTGDNVNNGLWMFVPGGTSVEEWLPGARQIYGYTEKLTPYSGHGEGLQTREDIARLIRFGEELIAQKTNSRRFKLRSYPENSENKIYYRADKVLTRKTRNSP